MFCYIGSSRNNKISMSLGSKFQYILAYRLDNIYKFKKNGKI